MEDYRRMADAELISACLQNDKHAWDALIRRYSRLIYATALRFGTTPEDANDVFQTVCITMLHQLSTLQDHRKLSTWLITLTRRKCYRLKMLHRPGLVSLEQACEVVEGLHDPLASSLEAEVWVLERQQILRQAVETLGEKCRELIRHLYYDDQPASHKVAAERLAVSAASIGRMRERCLKKLKDVLIGRGFRP